jgi:hypothetical protein
VYVKKNRWETDRQYIGKINGNIISVKGIQYQSDADPSSPGQTTVDDYTLMIGKDANTLTGKLTWLWSGRWGNCDGISNVSFRRKLEE